MAKLDKYKLAIDWDYVIEADDLDLERTAAIVSGLPSAEMTVSFIQDDLTDVFDDAPSTVALSYPANRWQAFKDRWFPRWLEKLFPVKFETIHSEGLVSAWEQATDEDGYVTMNAKFEGVTHRVRIKDCE